MSSNNEHLRFIAEELKEVKQEMKELRAFIQTHMNEEDKNIREIHVELAKLKERSRIWGAVAGTVGAVVTSLFIDSLKP